ncbi:putative zinc finger protein [Apostichopus japonicus]|uniref:Putative zinc finger protein n=1 Tax=Stichopus japonicus TaxID=307972 RepID=A0A2G8LMQ3_STIJA|nr:putative zinc finger protein [Apostichopus japonicus]
MTAAMPTSVQTSARKCSEWTQFYKEAMDNASQFNSRLISERKMRLPYLDSHTGVAQNNCHIWFEKYQRGEGLEDGQLHSYPARRWRKRPKIIQSSSNDSHDSKFLTDGGGDLDGEVSLDSFQDENSQDIYSSAAQERDQNYADLYFKEFDPQEDFRDAGEIDRAESEESDEDFEISYKKRKSRGRGRGGRRKAGGDTESMIGPVDKDEKPYPCKYCGKRYKNRQGLSYHTMHHHHDKEQEMEEAAAAPPPTNNSEGKNRILYQVLTSENTQAAPPTKGSKSEDGPVDSNNYCDFCLGDATENKKTGTQEELISCADCGRSGHPSCLQFTDVMISKVKGYKWQCIECKSCGLCGTSDNDDQLLFCDDCDRGYHMYCLTPVMSAPPEGKFYVF